MLDMSCLPTLLADGLMSFWGQNLLVGGPEITVTATALIRLWNAPPELAATLFAAITTVISDYLPGAPTQGNPNPAFIAFFEDERP